MLERGVRSLDPASNSLLFIEKVGNLVCPAMFDLGERFEVVILSVTAGEDKPLKYTHMFRDSGLMILNKIDLLPYVKFDVEPQFRTPAKSILRLKYYKFPPQRAKAWMSGTIGCENTYESNIH